MLKLIVCWLWGHDLDKDDTRTYEDTEGQKIIARGLKIWCKRCQKYRRVS